MLKVNIWGCLSMGLPVFKYQFNIDGATILLISTQEPNNC